MSLQPWSLTQDVLDHILDCVGDDPTTLARCALVGSDWTGRAQRNLFSRITLYFDKHGTPPRRSRYDKLIRTNPELALYTTHLHLKADWSPITGVCWQPHFASDLSHLSNVRSLKLEAFNPRDALYKVAQDVLKAFPSLEYLAFHDHIFAPLSHSGGDITERWSPPESSESVMVDVHATSTRPLALKGLSLISRLNDKDNVIARKQIHSLSLAQCLGYQGELTSLTSLELLDGPELTETWLPFFPAFGASLRRCAITLNDVAVYADRYSLYCDLTEVQLREKVTASYAVLLQCPNLQSLCIKVDFHPTLREGAVRENPDPKPLLSPFFVDALTALLSRPETPFRHLESLRFEIVGTIGSLVSLRDAFGALSDTLSVKGRYPAFTDTSVDLEEFSTGGDEDPATWVVGGRELLKPFEDAGMRVAFTFWKNGYCLGYVPAWSLFVPDL